MRSEGRVPDVPRCEARDLHIGLAHEKETVAYLMPRQTHAIDYDRFNPPEDVWQDGWQGGRRMPPRFRPSKARAAFGSTDLINCMIVATLLRLAV